MAGALGEPGDVVVFRCKARSLAQIIDGRFLSIRCRDRTCPDVQRAKETGAKVFHMLDLESGAEWTEFEPVSDRHHQEDLSDVCRQ